MFLIEEFPGGRPEVAIGFSKPAKFCAESAGPITQCCCCLSGWLNTKLYQYQTDSPFVPLLWTGVEDGKKRAGSWIKTYQRNSGLLLSLLAGTETAPPTIRLPLQQQQQSQVKLLLPKFHRADSALRSQAAGGMGVCASVAPPAFGCRLG